jgi:bifunctional non-homologous end joining protein LigD
VEVAGVSLSHPDRVVFPDPGLTKLDLARYYESIADRIVPHLAGRPLTLVRCPGAIGGDCVFMKHSKVWAPPALRRVPIQEKTKLGEYLVADSLAAVISLVQMDVVEIHTWNSRVEHVEKPDRIVLDLDPGPEVSWRQVIEGGRLVRAALAALGLESWPKTTGGRGLHVVAPLLPDRDWKECLAFARGIALAVEREHPRLYTTKFSKAGREAKILIDYLRNNRTNTSIAAFSARARQGAPVSFPVGWDELTTRLDPLRVGVPTVPRRLSRERRDPWKEYFRSRQRLTAAALRALSIGRIVAK